MGIKICFVVLLSFFLPSNPCRAVFDFDEKNPVHQAISKNDERLLEDLLRDPFNVESRGIYGRTPLGLAVRLEKVEIVNKLLLSYADPCAYDQFGRSVFHEALFNMRTSSDKKKSMAIIKRLLEYKLSLVNFWGKAKGKARFFDIPLCFALDIGDLELFVLLLECQTNLLNLMEYEINVIPDEYALEIIDAECSDEEILKNYTGRIIPIEMETFRKMTRQMKKLNELALKDETLDLHQRYLVDTAISNFMIKLEEAFVEILS